MTNTPFSQLWRLKSPGLGCRYIRFSVGACFLLADGWVLAVPTWAWLREHPAPFIYLRGH